jgi:hypothetical protein
VGATVTEHELEPRLAVAETRIQDNTTEIVKLRERMHNVEGTQAGVKLLAQQIEWQRQEYTRRDNDQKEREQARERELRSFVVSSTTEAINAAFEARGHRWGGAASLAFQGGGWAIGLATLVLAATHHIGGH